MYDQPLSLLLALLYLLAASFGMIRPTVIANWIAILWKSTGLLNDPAWLHGRSVVFFIRLISFMAFINAIMYLYLVQHAPQINIP